MAGLLPTNLKIVSAQLPPDFHGTPVELQRAFIERMEILSASGTNFFFTGDVEPPGDFGPWLRGLQWWVFDPSVGHYIPLDISASITALFTVSSDEPSAPGTGEAQIWVQTRDNRVLGWYFWSGTEWRPDGQTPPSGPTASRPTNAGDFETYFDTTINVLLHWERGAWRTVSGSPGDVKFVTASLLTDAIVQNPGWIYLGESDQTYRGRVIGVATKDPGATPASSYGTASGITTRASAATYGVESVLLADAEIPQHTHIVGGVGSLGSNRPASFYRVDNAEYFVAPGSAPPNHQLTTSEFSSIAGGLPVSGTGCVFVTSKQLSDAIAANYTDPATAHENMPPTKYLWALVKQ
jgi:microcystin-dependent protein